jgi:hypothetical protein
MDSSWLHEPKSDYLAHGRGTGVKPLAIRNLQLPLHPRLIDLAWAGGLYDGEGCLSSTKGRPRYLVLTVTQAGGVDRAPEVLQRFRQAVCGIGFIDGPDLTEAWKPRWRYRVSGILVVELILSMLWPWLGSVKRQQATTLLDRAHAVPRGQVRPGNHFGRPLKDVCVRGHPYDDVYVDSRGTRHCIPCRRERDRLRARSRH